ncbi:MAG: hypothetical protein HY704_02310, partial [Gemmatimonadetes bacterium]|nr:hypothetical protein [Gemmatimonadota bacterium]
ADAGIPVYFYGAASNPPGRTLAELRHGGYEAVLERFPPGRDPDLLPHHWPHPGVHPRWGATCVGARKLLLAWNVYLQGVELEEARSIAAELRDVGGGFTGLRALALALPSRRAMQISMNLEDLEATAPASVFEAILRRVREIGGTITGTEVIGMIPDALVLSAAGSRLHLLDPAPERLLSQRLALHVAERAAAVAREVVEAVAAEGDAVPEAVRVAVRRLARNLVRDPGSHREA